MMPQAQTATPTTVLLIEDEESVRNLIRRTLERAGLRVLSAANGKEAIALASEVTSAEGIDVILSDVVIPAPPLTEVLERVREHIGTPALILISGYPREHVAGRIPSWPNEYIEKPFSIEKLRATVIEMAAEHRRATR